jgi:hypothetical protein
MKKKNVDESTRNKGKLRYRDTLRMLKEYLVPLQPDPGFSRRLEVLCESMGAGDLFGAERDLMIEKTGRRGIIIGGAICSALPFVGVAAYAVGKHLSRRRVVPLGI